MTMKFSKDHEWLKVDGDTAYFGITSYAAEQLGDVVYVELPEVGKSFAKGDASAVVESVKAASDVYSPASGSVIAINDALNDNPALVNEAAETDGWFAQIKLSNPSETDEMMDVDAYKAYLDTL